MPAIKRCVLLVRAGALSALLACLTFGGSPTLTAAQTTPIKHLVVIFQENVSFDHHFGTYPYALNPTGEPPFQAAPGTPMVNGLAGPLVTNNPNLANPQRLGRPQAATCDQDHGYTHEQQACDNGVMDLFVQFTGYSLTVAQCLAAEKNPAPAGGVRPNYAVMDYYDGNTVTAADYQDGHAGYSNPLDEQTFLAETINHLQKSSSWKDTAVVILYDDSDGWYDHQFGPVVTQSRTMLDGLSGTGLCGANPSGVPSGQQARCGAGMRQPLLVISPFSKSNYVDDSFTTQASVVQFIEDNWLAGQRIGGGSVDGSTGSLNNLFDFEHGDAGRTLLLDPSTGEPLSATR